MLYYTFIRPTFYEFSQLSKKVQSPKEYMYSHKIFKIKRELALMSCPRVIRDLPMSTFTEIYLQEVEISVSPEPDPI